MTLRSQVRAREDLVEIRIALVNQLRAHLQVVFPGAVGFLQHIDSWITLRFPERFPSTKRAALLSETRLADWLSPSGHCGINTPSELHRRPC